jgi:GT2 family glycosyltransferase
VVVVDNGSSDDSLEVARGHADGLRELKVISLPENQGLNAARNVGIENASGSVVAFIDNDARALGDWILGALEAMQQLDADAVQCKLLLGNDPKLIDSVGYLIGPFGFPRQIVRPGASNSQATDQPRYLFGAKGAGMMFRRDLLLKIGGFDPSFFLYGDETELFWRIFRVGGAVALAPQSIVLHNSGGTKRFLSSAADDLLYRGGTRNYIRMIAKNQHPRRVVFDIMGQVCVWSAVAACQAMRGRRGAARLIMRGIAEAVHELPSLQRSRAKDKLPFRTVPRALKARMTISYLREIGRAV